MSVFAALFTIAIAAPVLPTFTPNIDLIAGDTYINPIGAGAWDHQLRLERAHLGLLAESGAVHGRVLLESVSSTSNGALLGVAGSSVVMRVREAFAGVDTQLLWPLEIAVGIVPSLVIRTLDGVMDLRVLGASTTERLGFMLAADIGARARLSLPENLGLIEVSFTNGEGYTGSEQNRGKNTHVSCSLTPLRSLGFGEAILLAAYTDGSSGAGSTRADRALMALGWESERLSALASATYAWGVANNSQRTAWLVEGGVRFEPYRNLLTAVRVDYIRADASVKQSTAFNGTAALGYRFAPVEVFVAAHRSWLGDAAQSAMFGSENFSSSVTVRARF